MKSATLIRAFTNKELTLGMISVDGVETEPVFTMEPAARRIPSGSYKVTTYASPKFRMNVYLLHDVPGRNMIEIHPGNRVTETGGCILPGLSFGELAGLPAVLNSKSALNYLKTLLGESFIINVVEIRKIQENMT